MLYWSGPGSLGQIGHRSPRHTAGRGPQRQVFVTGVEELEHLGVGFESQTEALDLTTPAGRAMAGLLAVLPPSSVRSSENTHGPDPPMWQNGKRLGRPATAAMHTDEVRKLHRSGLSKSAIAHQLNIGRTSVCRILDRRTQG